MDDIVRAHIELLPTADGGLRAPMPSPTRSLILIFRSLDDENPEATQIGAQLTATSGNELSPGETLEVSIDFWADVGRIYATVGVSFDLWYAGRVIGSGVVLRTGSP